MRSERKLGRIADLIDEGTVRILPEVPRAPWPEGQGARAGVLLLHNLLEGMMNWFTRWLRRRGWNGPYTVLGFGVGKVKGHTFLTLDAALDHRDSTDSMSPFAVQDYWGRDVWRRGELLSDGYGSGKATFITAQDVEVAS